MNARIFFWSLTSALAGFLFGFDIVVISGAEKTIQALWGLSPELHGIAMASAFFACMMVLQLLWVATMVPETKGVPLEQIQKRRGMDFATDEL